MRIVIVATASLLALGGVGCSGKTSGGSSTTSTIGSGSNTSTSGSGSNTSTSGTSGSTGTTACAGLVPPDQTANCPCQSGHTCTANNCYGGYWCDTNQNRCVRPPTNCGTATGTTSSTTTTGTSSGPGPTGVSSLPTCSNRPSADTQINALVRVDQYLGVRTGGSGQHEDFYGTMTQVIAVDSSSKVDTMNVEVAMRIAGSSNPAGLPGEIPLTAGQVIEVAGDYIPASTASCSDSAGSCAVIHFTHSPCGWVYINPTTYQ
jgi:hypothetical protein